MATQALDLKPIESKLVALSNQARDIVVSDARSYSMACQIAVEVRAEVKAIGFALDPGIESARRHLDELRNQKKAFLDRLTPIIDTATRKAEFWKSEERKKAQAEQDRINEERRREAAAAAEMERKAAEARAEAERKQREKELREAQKAGEISKRKAEQLKKEAAEAEAAAKRQAEAEARVAAANVQEVKVAPAVPKVAGIKARVNWKFKIVDASKLPRVYLKADEVAIGMDVRKVENKESEQAHKARVETLIPGIEVSAEDSV